ncbi:MAG: RNA polymerase factor sigma-54 [Prevotellaceae bacterium]|jgi:RNA polymerase sigma-54 factor|nr:RNA polymerase factor sigma-54 [Prevotellaceae bacterium]
MLNQIQKQQQQQQLTPQQIQLVKLIELPSAELEERIIREIEENPALEIDVNNSENPADDLTVEIPKDDERTDEYERDDDIPDYKLHTNNYSAGSKREDIPFSAGVSFHEHLLDQLALQSLTERQRTIAEYLIGNIDTDGYMRRDSEGIINDMLFQTGTEASEEELQEMLALIQEFDPAGVGAGSLQECLLLQLRRKEMTGNNKLAIKILSEYFEEFSKHHFEKIVKKLGISEEQFKEILQEIVKLNPKPGSNWGVFYEKNKEQITPDFILETQDDELLLSLNTGHLPALAVSPAYSRMLDEYKADKQPKTRPQRDAFNFMKQKTNAARDFIDAIEQRQNTLINTMDAIVKFQHRFFASGLEYDLKPMILKDIAEMTGYDISTISRVSNSKYIQTDFGVFPLKSFFSEAMQTTDGEEISSREVKAILTDCIAKEDKRRPLTDDALSEILKKRGYVIARRTVAKYREQLGIPVARLRKEL